MRLPSGIMKQENHQAQRAPRSPQFSPLPRDVMELFYFSLLILWYSGITSSTFPQTMPFPRDRELEFPKFPVSNTQHRGTLKRGNAGERSLSHNISLPSQTPCVSTGVFFNCAFISSSLDLWCSSFVGRERWGRSCDLSK